MNLIKTLQRVVVRQRLQKSKIPLRLWHRTIVAMPMVQRYTAQERLQLRLLAGEVLRLKQIVPVQGMALTDEIRVTLATQVAILVFGLESVNQFTALDWLRNWNYIIVYPTPFRNGRENLLSPNGLVMSQAAVQSGETSHQGGIIIDWQDDAPHPLRANANQVLIHEMAHKLDMLDGSINGHPPLHTNMNEADWFRAFEAAYETLQHQINHGQMPLINPYAATNPAEFFAVSTEYFFEVPQRLKCVFPDVYQQLCLFYKQDLAR